MAELIWDAPGSRNYMTGLDKGVLYLPDGSAVPWNGLTSVVETADTQKTPVYYEGMKISEILSLGSFTASMKAVTYPDEFEELEGFAGDQDGVLYADQPPQAFGLCYRTIIGNSFGDVEGYQLHILYNVTAIPKDKTYATLSDQPSLVEFEWDISAIPEEIPNFRPTAHVIVNSNKVDPVLLEELEKILYGDADADALLLPMADLVYKIANFFRFKIVDNGDGTWTAITEQIEFIDILPEEYFELTGINAWYLDDETYVVESTTGSSDVPDIRIWDVGDGTWTAHSEFDILIVPGANDTVTIYNANTRYINSTTYEITDTFPGD